MSPAQTRTRYSTSHFCFFGFLVIGFLVCVIGVRTFCGFGEETRGSPLTPYEFLWGRTKNGYGESGLKEGDTAGKGLDWIEVQPAAALPVKAVMAGADITGEKLGGLHQLNEAGLERRRLKKGKILKMPPAVCGAGRASCVALGHPEICCPLSARCLQTQYTLSGVYCCSSEDCTDRDLACPPSTFTCSAENSGGCCPIGTICAPDRCIPLADLPRYSSLLAAGVTILPPGQNDPVTTKGPTTLKPREDNHHHHQRGEALILNPFPTHNPIIEVSTIPAYPPSNDPPQPIITPAPGPRRRTPDLDDDGLSDTEDPTEAVTFGEPNLRQTTRTIRVPGPEVTEYTFVRTRETPRPTRAIVTGKDGRLRQGAPVWYDAVNESYTGGVGRVGVGSELVGSGLMAIMGAALMVVAAAGLV